MGSAYSGIRGPVDALIDKTRALPEFRRVAETQRGQSRYYQSRVEVWARAFQQYVVERTEGDLSAFRKWETSVYGENSGVYWGEESWPTVRAEVEAVLTNSGLLR